MESPDATLAKKPAKTRVVLRVVLEVEKMDPDDQDISEGEMALAGKEAVENALANAFHEGGFEFDYQNVLAIPNPATVEFSRGRDITEP